MQLTRVTINTPELVAFRHLIEDSGRLGGAGQNIMLRNDGWVERIVLML